MEIDFFYISVPQKKNMTIYVYIHIYIYIYIYEDHTGKRAYVTLFTFEIIEFLTFKGFCASYFSICENQNSFFIKI